MTKITLTDLANLQNENSAVTVINNNNVAVRQAIENTLSRDGTAPNQMEANLDMNANRLLNLPSPVSVSEPLRLQDLIDFQGGGLVIGGGAGVPDGGTTGQLLTKLSGSDQDTGWSDPALSIVSTPTVNQFTVWSTASSIKGVSITGLVKGNGASAPTAAVAGTDYQAPIGTISGIAKGNGANALTAAVAGTDYQSPIGTISGVVKGNGANALTAATAGTDYVAPGTATNFTAQQYSGLVTITDQATLAWTVSSGQKAKVTLGGNRTMGAVTGAVEGASYFLWVLQDGTGSRTITWTTTGAGSFDFGQAGAPTLTTTASRADLLTFEAISIGGTLKLRFAGIARGFS